ncbi:hypothetical protein [Glaciecola petra]|uniref:Uncharacterized protein n=1 Tax=Glaciecola petra TaxID=3075602 RepID=A0ABU2ZMT5_9ALTE|nr:hypothetical protein [Aestuariibacter sp. P117]MDT0593664.1 hypothetical protein [Aestuariibacter sp. P117]
MKQWLTLSLLNILSFIPIILVFLILLLANVKGFGEFKTNSEFTTLGLTVSVISKILIILPICILCNKNVLVMHKVIGTVCLLHVIFFGIQYLLVYTVGFYPDPLNLIVGKEQRYIAGMTLPLIGEVYRPTGMYYEPSTYATYMLILVATRMCLVNQLNRIDIIVLLSTIFSFSAAAIVYSSLALFIGLMSKEKLRQNIRIMIPLFLLLVPVIYWYFVGRLDMGHREFGSLRLGLIVITFTQSQFEILFGNGLMGIPTQIDDMKFFGGLAQFEVAAINDAGLWLFNIIKFGIVGLILVLISQKLIISSVRPFLFVLTIYLTKASLFDATLIFCFLIPYFIRMKMLKNVQIENITYDSNVNS